LGTPRDCNGRTQAAASLARPFTVDPREIFPSMYKRNLREEKYIENIFERGRTNQSCLLSHLDAYLQNRRLHLVAAPGSGKTVLGLEVIKRVNQPTLVLAPTITIRDQWVDRLVDLFLPPRSGKPTWVSTELRSPAFVTVATYQALHALCAGEPEEQAQPIEAEENGDSKNHVFEPLNNGTDANQGAQGHILLPEAFTEAKFRALVLDEAHHLRAEWWKTLTFVAEQLDNPTIVALTATPPYDVSPFE